MDSRARRSASAGYLPTVVPLVLMILIYLLVEKSKSLQTKVYQHKAINEQSSSYFLSAFSHVTNLQDGRRTPTDV